MRYSPVALSFGISDITRDGRYYGGSRAIIELGKAVLQTI